MLVQRNRCATLILGAAMVWSAGCSFDPSGPQAAPRDSSAIAPDGARAPDARISDARTGKPDAAIADAAIADAAIADAAPPDAAPPDASCPGDVLSFVPSNFTQCDIPAATTSLNLNTFGIWTIDTDSGTLQGGGTSQALSGVLIPQNGAPDLYLVSFNGVTIDNGASLSAVGSHPLAIVSFGDIQVTNGHISVNASGSAPGAGGDDPTACAQGTGANGGTKGGGGGGGGGGGYGANGGKGATVDGTTLAKANGGMANGAPNIVPLQGGCRGGKGGESGGGSGGPGAGGLQLVAKGAITVASGGTISASGGGGGAVNRSSSGGGGGGSGGAVLLEASSVQIDGAVTANGGGGGEGSRGGSMSAPGQPGHDGDGNQALGGDSGNRGGNGGNGGALSGAAQDGHPGTSDATAAGGGGGGGSIGRIHINSPSKDIKNGTLSPAPK